MVYRIELMGIIRRVITLFLDLIEVFVIALAMFVVMYLFLFQPHQVRGNSMLPNFEDGEYLLTDKISYRFREPSRGDVIIFKAPRNEDYDYIKRIVGLPGETIRIENNRLFINNNPFSESYLPQGDITYAGTFLQEGKSTLIPKGDYLVLGDNRNHSSDSREWGFVPKENIIGKAWIRYWPTSRLGIIPEAKYDLSNRQSLYKSSLSALQFLPSSP